MKRWRFILLPCALAASLAFGFAAEPLKVVSLNVRYSAGSDGNNRWELRREAVVEMIESVNPDLVGLQEALPDQSAFLDSALCLYGHVGVGRDDGAGKGEKMEIFYRLDRFDLCDSGTFWLSPTPNVCSFGWDAACRRTATWVELEECSSGRRLLYINTHFDHIGRVAQRNSAEQIAKFIRKRGCKITLLTGDLNVTPDDAVLKPLRRRLGDARRDATVTDTKHSFNAFGRKGSQMTIDYIFYRGLEPVEFRTVDDNWGVPYISDHYPIEAVFEMPQ